MWPLLGLMFSNMLFVTIHQHQLCAESVADKHPKIHPLIRYPPPVELLNESIIP
jgi:hypothetical protein